MIAPRFSVIIPIHNAEPYLRECVDSALRQAGADAELILFDDGSSDGSGEICDEYAAANPAAVRAFHQENAGLVLTRRCALRAAQGRYILFLDADDRLAPDALDALREILGRDEPDVILYHWARMDASGALTGFEIPLYLPAEGLYGREDVLSAMAAREDLNSLCIKLIRRELFDLDADYAPFARVTNGEDLLQSLPAVLAAESFYYLPRSLYHYRQNEGSMTYASRKGNAPYLTIARPRLLAALRAAGLDGDDDLTAFFGISVQRVWAMLDASARRMEDGLEPLLEDILAEPSVRRIGDYLCRLPLTAYRRLVLRVYLRGHLFAALRLLRLRNRLLRVS